MADPAEPHPLDRLQWAVQAVGKYGSKEKLFRAMDAVREEYRRMERALADAEPPQVPQAPRPVQRGGTIEPGAGPLEVATPARLAELRQQIDRMDEALGALIGLRISLGARAAAERGRHSDEPLDLGREGECIVRAISCAVPAGSAAKVPDPVKRALMHTYRGIFEAVRGPLPHGDE